MSRWSITVHPRPSLLAAVRQMVKDSLLQTRATYDVDDAGQEPRVESHRSTAWRAEWLPAGEALTWA